MTKHIDQQRTEVLARRDYLLGAVTPLDEDHNPMKQDEIEAELDKLNAALGKLDELAQLGDTRPYPRLKVRLVPEWADGIDVDPDRRWLVSVRHEADEERETVLGMLPDMRTAHGAAIEYVAVQRFLADRLAHPHGAGL